MVSRLLYLQPGQFRRAWPFLLLYMALFAALTLADGLSLALFVARVGAERLPRFQALSAVLVMLSVGVYLWAAGRLPSERVFIGILAGPMLLFALIAAGYIYGAPAGPGLGLLFVGREVMFALVLLHFGAYLQDYFLRAELNRVMPVIYAGGRIGGILGGALLEHGSRYVQPPQLLLLIVLLLAACIAGVKLIHRVAATVDEPDEPDSPHRSESSRVQSTSSPPSFFSLVWRSPLLFWITVGTTALFFCRSGLALECSLCFEARFARDVELAQFLGRYAQIALVISLVLQLFVVNRLVDRMGLGCAHLAYAALLAAAAVSGWGGMTLAAAVYARFVEGELRYGLRNPVAQMTVNFFPKPIRTQVRAWSLGFLIPAATLVASLGLDALLRAGSQRGIAFLTIAAGVAYLVASLGLAATIPETRHRLLQHAITSLSFGTAVFRERKLRA
jgi:ATP/ADP translocase